MPLQAYVGSDLVSAFGCSTDAWAELRKTARRTGVRTKCCGEVAYLRTTKGTQHFVHRRRAARGSARESAEHLRLKTLVARAATTSGWAVETEASGKAPDGRAWRADVLCARGTARVAFEIQTSRQALAVTMARQQALADSGVRGCWLLGGGDASWRLEHTVDDREDLPAFELAVADDGDVRVSRFDVALDVFVAAALGGRLHFRREPPYNVELELVEVATKCWKCATRLVVPAGWGVVLCRGKKRYKLSCRPSDEAAAAVPRELLRHYGDFFVRGDRGVRRQVAVGCPRCSAGLSVEFGEPEQAAKLALHRWEVGRARPRYRCLGTAADVCTLTDWQEAPPSWVLDA